MGNMKALSFGEILFDIVEGNFHIGGAPLNLAAHLQKMGAECAIVSVVGSDELGNRALEKIRNIGIDTTYVLVDEKSPTGTVIVDLDERGVPSYSINENVAWDSIILDEMKIESIISKEWDIFCFGTLAQRSEKNRDSLKKIFSQIKQACILYDVNLRQDFYEIDWILDSLKVCDVVKLNLEEVDRIDKLIFQKSTNEKEFCEKLIEKFPNISIVCITKGEDGAAIYHYGNYIEIDPIKVDVVDTVGAGDGFSAAFLYSHILGNNPADSARFACEFGAYVASNSGAIPDYSSEIHYKLEKVKSDK